MTKVLYCVKCRQKTLANDLQQVITKNGHHMLRGKCVTCGLKKTQFVKKPTTGGDLAASLSAITSNVKLPWAKYPGEMHLPGMNFAGPGTNLNERLTSTEVYKDWSKPVDRVDNAAYHHDLAYQHFPDTATRNVTDRLMIQEMDAIKDPTLHERVERGIIRPIIKAKQKFGMGVKKKSDKMV